jgi:hypothetical protein
LAATANVLRDPLLRISSTHFSAPLLRDVGAEDIEQLEERGDCRADSELSIVDFDEIHDDPGIGFLSADTQRALQDTRDGPTLTSTPGSADLAA